MMNKLIRCILPLVFCCITAAASVRFVKITATTVVDRAQRQGGAPATDAEKLVQERKLERAAPPTSVWSRLAAWNAWLKGRIESVCDTSIFGQQYLRQFDGVVTKLVTGRPRPRQIIYGKNGWLFYDPDNDVDPIGDYCGRIRYGDEVLQECRDGINRMDEWCRRRGIDFYVAIFPNKESVYDEFMPSSVFRHSTITRTDVLVEYLRTNTDVRIVYPKEKLRQAKSCCHVYYPRDTHWNQVGAYVGVQELLGVMGRPRREVGDCEIIVLKHRHEDDLVLLGHLEGEGYEKDDELMIRGMPQLRAREAKWDEYWENRNESATYGRERLLIVGDSFRMAMLPALSREFGLVGDVHRRDSRGFSARVEAFKPTVIVLEFVERYSGKIGSTVFNLIGK